jgi:hypothetical protein
MLYLLDKISPHRTAQILLLVLNSSTSLLTIYLFVDQIQEIALLLFFSGLLRSFELGGGVDVLRNHKKYTVDFFYGSLKLLDTTWVSILFSTGAFLHFLMTGKFEIWHMLLIGSPIFSIVGKFQIYTEIAFKKKHNIFLYILDYLINSFAILMYCVIFFFYQDKEGALIFMALDRVVMFLLFLWFFSISIKHLSKCQRLYVDIGSTVRQQLNTIYALIEGMPRVLLSLTDSLMATNLLIVNEVIHKSLPLFAYIWNIIIANVKKESDNKSRNTIIFLAFGWVVSFVFSVTFYYLTVEQDVNYIFVLIIGLFSLLLWYGRFLFEISKITVNIAKQLTIFFSCLVLIPIVNIFQLDHIYSSWLPLIAWLVVFSLFERKVFSNFQKLLS